MGLDYLKKTRPPTLDVWIIALGDQVTREHFEMCSNAVDPSMVPQKNYLKGEIAWRYIVGSLLPQFTMRQRHVPRKDWEFARAKTIEGPGKPYLTLKYDPEDPNNERPAMGFAWAEAGAALAFAHSLGPREIVINIGTGIRQMKIQGSAKSYFDSNVHLLTRSEAESISLAKLDEQASIRRLNIIMALKDAYLCALGQPIGFDQSRISTDVASCHVTVDGSTITGWDFHIFSAMLNSKKKPGLKADQDDYLVVVAVFRGSSKTRMIFEREERMGYVKFFNIDQIISDVPRLGDYDGTGAGNGVASGSPKEKEREKDGRMPPVEKIPITLSNQSSRETLVPGHTKKEKPSPLSRQPSQQSQLPPSYSEKDKERGKNVPISSHHHHPHQQHTHSQRYGSQTYLPAR